MTFPAPSTTHTEGSTVVPGAYAAAWPEMTSSGPMPGSIHVTARYPKKSKRSPYVGRKARSTNLSLGDLANLAGEGGLCSGGQVDQRALEKAQVAQDQPWARACHSSPSAGVPRSIPLAAHAASTHSSAALATKGRNAPSRSIRPFNGHVDPSLTCVV